MPMASANATPRIMLVWMAARASGLRPRASIALATSMPMPIAGADAAEAHREAGADRLADVRFIERALNSLLEEGQQEQDRGKVHAW